LVLVVVVDCQQVEPVLRLTAPVLPALQSNWIVLPVVPLA
jgi:hypothetical protein